MLGEISRLLGLQRADEALVEARSHTDRLRAQRRAIEKKIDSERAAVAALREELQRLERDSKMRNLEVDELDAHIRGYQKRLDEGIISFKEMEDLRVKIASEKARIDRLEDEALEAMAAIETARGALVEAEGALVPREAQLRETLAAIDVEISGSTSQSEALAAERSRLSLDVPPYLLSQYEALRANVSHPVATLEHGTCGGCKLRVSANTVERARGGMGVVTCEHCSRILYVS
ncbi:MAG: C4-type zinc ribbon domain-containing protein [Candidatus Bipolaricaulota bacterium]